MNSNQWLEEPVQINKIKSHIDELFPVDGADNALLNYFLRDRMKRDVEIAVANLGQGATNLHAISRAVRGLEALKTEIDAAAHNAWTSIGFNRVVNNVDGLEEHTFFDVMYDDDSPLQFTDGTDIDEELSEEISRQGAVTSIHVTYPRSDRYGIPSEAWESGAREWLWSRGFAVTETLAVTSEDGGDDSMMSCEITVCIPPELAEQLNEYGMPVSRPGE